MLKPLLILAIHPLEIIHVRQKHIHLDDLGHARPRGDQDRRDVLAAHARLVGDVAADELAFAVRGDLAGDVDLVGGADGLGLERRAARPGGPPEGGGGAGLC